MSDTAAPKRVRIAVVDSGVAPEHDHILADRIQPGIGINPDGTVEEGATADHLGHGTAVTAAIQQWAPEADITPVRVFTQKLTTSPRALLLAVQWCIDQRFDLVNLSLGTRVPEHAALFAQAAEISREEGVVLVAAHSVGDELCYPGSLPDAIGVAIDWDLPRDGFCLFESGAEASDPAQATCAASGYPRPIPGVEQRRNLFGVSFSVANMTGLAAAQLAKAEAFQPGKQWDDWESVDRLSLLLSVLKDQHLADS